MTPLSVRSLTRWTGWKTACRARYLMGDTLTEADWRLFTTLVRFDSVYHLHFKCNRRRVVDYPNLWAYTRELYQRPGVAETVNMDHIVRHYHYSHDSINPHRIIPINPVLDFGAAHGMSRPLLELSHCHNARPSPPDLLAALVSGRMHTRCCACEKIDPSEKNVVLVTKMTRASGCRKLA